VARWQQQVYPAIAREARLQKADIYFWDESGFRADSVHGKTWAAKGKTPVVRVPGHRQTISAASAVNSKGGFGFSTYQGSLNAERFVQLLRKMMEGAKHPVHLVLDNLPAHKTAAALRPDEQVWSYAKRTGLARSPLRTGKKLAERIHTQLAQIKANPDLVRSFFNHPMSPIFLTCE